LYNGNISQTQWRTASTDNTLKSYGYTYDALNRIVWALDNLGNYEVSNITYDKMGNILTLTRDGWQDDNGTITYTNMDILDYEYGPGNQLSKVSDAGNVDYGFKDGTNTNDDFIYDANGNLEIDRNKGITGVTYNHLNLPTEVAINGSGGNGTIDYIYDATGIKLKKTVSSTGNSIEYAGNFVYEYGTLQFFNTPEGYVNANGGGYEYIYQYKDHLGNVRVSYTDDPSNPGQATIIEENNYYPFGGRHNGYNMGGDSSLGNDLAQMWKYNGKEFDESLGFETYDFGARNYDPWIGRWMNIDPATDLLEMSSPYVYALNDPTVYIDLDGELPILINGRAACENCRGNANYWGNQILNTIRNSGIANPHTNSDDEFHFVDGDQFFDNNSGYDLRPRNRRAGFLSGNNAGERRRAGIRQASTDFQTILSKLARDPKSGKIIEKIQIYTHSRGAAFGEGYTQQLLNLIGDYADEFADPTNVVQFILNLASHQSGSVDTPSGVNGVSLHHDNDLLSGNNMGNTTALSSNIGDDVLEAHNVESFTDELSSFLGAFLSNDEQVNQSTIDDFIKNAKDRYGIDVKINQ